MPYKGHVGLGVLWSLTPRQPPAPSCPLSLGFPGRRCQGGLAPTSEFSASDHNTNISFLPSVSVHLSVCLPRPSQPGLPPPPLPAPLRGPQQSCSPHLRAGLAAPAWGAARGPHLHYLSLLFPTGNGWGEGPPLCPHHARPHSHRMRPGWPVCRLHPSPAVSGPMCVLSVCMCLCAGGTRGAHLQLFLLQEAEGLADEALDPSVTL